MRYELKNNQFVHGRSALISKIARNNNMTRIPTDEGQGAENLRNLALWAVLAYFK